MSFPKEKGDWTLSETWLDRKKSNRAIGKRTREEIGTGNRMTALKSQTGCAWASCRHHRPPFRGQRGKFPSGSKQEQRRRCLTHRSSITKSQKQIYFNILLPASVSPLCLNSKPSSTPVWSSSPCQKLDLDDHFCEHAMYAGLRIGL